MSTGVRLCAGDVPMSGPYTHSLLLTLLTSRLHVYHVQYVTDYHLDTWNYDHGHVSSLMLINSNITFSFALPACLITSLEMLAVLVSAMAVLAR